MADGPSDNDVLFGRGAVFHHPGNQALRDMLIPRMEQYQNLPTPRAKTEFVNDIMERLRARNIRFWRRNNEGRWQEATPEAARSKVLGLLRDKIPRRMHETYFQQRRLDDDEEEDILDTLAVQIDVNGFPSSIRHDSSAYEAQQWANGPAPQQPVAWLHEATHQAYGMAMSQPVAAFNPVASMNSQLPRGLAPLQQMHRTLAAMDQSRNDSYVQGSNGRANLNLLGSSQGAEMPLQTDDPGSSTGSEDILDVLAALVDVDGLPSSLRQDSSADEAQQPHAEMQQWARALQGSNGPAPQLGNMQPRGQSSFTVAPQGNGDAASFYTFGIQGSGTSASASTFAYRPPDAQENVSAFAVPGTVFEAQGGATWNPTGDLYQGEDTNGEPEDSKPSARESSANPGVNELNPWAGTAFRAAHGVDENSLKSPLEAIDVDSAGPPGQEGQCSMIVNLNSQAEHSFQEGTSNAGDDQVSEAEMSEQASAATDTLDKRMVGTSLPRPDVAEDEDEEMEAPGSRPVSPDLA